MKQSERLKFVLFYVGTPVGSRSFQTKWNEVTAGGPDEGRQKYEVEKVDFGRGKAAIYGHRTARILGLHQPSLQASPRKLSPRFLACRPAFLIFRFFAGGSGVVSPILLTLLSRVYQEYTMNTT